MNKSKVFLWWFFGAFLVAILLLPVLNLYIDSSRVLTRDYAHSYKNRQGNINFLKMAYLLKHRDEFDSLIFGSSRIRYGFNPRQLNAVLGGHWYKMEYPGGVPSDHLYNLGLLLEKGFKPKAVILTIDDFDLYSDRTPRQHDYFYRPYPASTSEWIDFYQFYLFKKPTTVDRKILLGQLKLKETERIVHPDGFAHSRKSVQKHEKHMLSLLPQGWNYGASGHRMDALLDDIRSIIRLCDKHGIDLTIMVTPRYYKTLLARDFKLIANFKKRLAAIHPFVDFTTLNALTMDNRNWHDASHFFTNVGKKVALALKDPGRVPGSFGVLVNERNVDAHIQAIQEQIRANMVPLMQYDQRIIVHPSLLGPTNYLGDDLGKTIARKHGLKLRKRRDGMFRVTATSRKNAIVISNHGVFSGQYAVLRIRLRSPERVKKGFIVIIPGEKKSVERHVWDVAGGRNEFDVLVNGTQLARGIRLVFKPQKTYFLKFIELRSAPVQVGKQ